MCVCVCVRVCWHVLTADLPKIEIHGNVCTRKNCKGCRLANLVYSLHVKFTIENSEGDKHHPLDGFTSMVNSVWYAHVCVHVYTLCVSVYTCVCAWMCVCIVCKHVCVCVCMHARMSVCMCVHQ